MPASRRAAAAMASARATQTTYTPRDGEGRYRVGDGVMLRQLAFGLAGVALVCLGTAASFVQGLLRLQAPPRPLALEEEELLRKIFWNALDLQRMRIIEGRAGLFSVGPRAFTLGNTSI